MSSSDAYYANNLKCFNQKVYLFVWQVIHNRINGPVLKTTAWQAVPDYSSWFFSNGNPLISFNKCQKLIGLSINYKTISLADILCCGISKTFVFCFQQEGSTPRDAQSAGCWCEDTWFHFELVHSRTSVFLLAENVDEPFASLFTQLRTKLESVHANVL